MRRFPRVTARSPEPTGPAGQGESMMRPLAGLYALGGTLLAIALLIGAQERLETTVIASVASYTIAVVLYFGRRRLPSWSPLLFLSCGSLLIEWVVYQSGES